MTTSSGPYPAGLNLVGDEGAASIGESSVFGKLEDLRLTRNDIGEDGLESLLALPKLRALDFRDNNVHVRELWEYEQRKPGLKIRR